MAYARGNDDPLASQRHLHTLSHTLRSTSDTRVWNISHTPNLPLSAVAFFSFFLVELLRETAVVCLGVEYTN